MIDALISGRLYSKPAQRTAKNGNPFATATVRAAAGNGDALFVSVIAFSSSVVTALLALSDGESVCLAGELAPKVWTDRNGETRPGLDLVAHAVLSPYHVTRRRTAVTEREHESA